MITKNLFIKRSLSSFALLSMLMVLGCSDGPKLAPVSGVVTFDGKPYPNAVVSFQPIGSKGNENPGRGSSAITDKDGRFVLIYDGLEKGAVVGRHRVRISTNGSFSAGPDKEGGSDDYTPPSSIKVDPIPLEWRGDSKNEFEVPAGGTDKANFDILSKKKK